VLKNSLLQERKGNDEKNEKQEQFSLGNITCVKSGVGRTIETEVLQRECQTIDNCFAPLNLVIVSTS